MRRRSATLFFALTVAGILSVTLTERLEAAAPTPADPKKAPKVKKPPVAPRNCADPLDRDRDQDGHPVMECGGDDCDDTDAFRFPGAGREFCAGSLPDGRAAAAHDEDCNPCTVTASGADGDEDLDGAIAFDCSNPFLGATATGCEQRMLRVDTVDRRVRGGDCDDTNSAVRPGEQICASADRVSLCMPMGAMSSIPTSRAAPRTTTIDKKSGFAAMKCADGGTCQSQPSGAGVCVK